jgi:hypothetical protein
LEIWTLQGYCSLIPIRITCGKKNHKYYTPKRQNWLWGLTQPHFQGYRGSFPDGTAKGHEDDNSTTPGATMKKQYAVMERRGTTLTPCITCFEDHSHEAGNNKNI